MTPVFFVLAAGAGSPLATTVAGIKPKTTVAR
jgi:hypothetical protein